jgi:hypothetical protein
MSCIHLIFEHGPFYLEKFLNQLASMLALRWSRLRFWPKAALASSPIPRNSFTGSPTHAANYRKMSLNFVPSLASRNSSSSRSAMNLAGEKSRHAEISAYVDRLNSQDVQV